MRTLKQSTARNLMVFVTDEADPLSGKTGLTLTITASKNGGAFGSISPTVTERGSGWYSLALTTSHTDTLGDFALHITATGATPADVLCVVSVRLVDDVLPTASYTAPDNAGIADIPNNAEFAAAMALLATSAQLVKVLAAVYDTATVSGSTITLSNGATQVVSSGRTTTEP